MIFVFKLLTVSFCFLIFVVYLVIVKFIILFKYAICFCRQLCWILASIQKLMLSIRRKSAVILFVLSIQTCAACFFGKARQSLSWWSPSKHYISLFKNNHSSVKVLYQRKNVSSIIIRILNSYFKLSAELQALVIDDLNLLLHYFLIFLHFRWEPDWFFAEGCHITQNRIREECKYLDRNT